MDLYWRVTGDRLQVTSELIFLGLLPSGKLLDGSMASLRILIWKYLLWAFVQVDTEGVRFKPNQVWQAALARLKSKIHTYFLTAHRAFDRRMDKGQAPFIPATTNQHLQPLATISMEDPPVALLLDYHPVLASL